jgi:hypothetical protein
MKGIITAVFVVAIVIASSLIIVSNIMPMIEENQAHQDLSKAKQVMSELDSVINELIFEARGSMRSMNIVADGSLVVSGKEDSIKFSMNKVGDISLYEPGTVKKEGNLLIARGPFIKAYEKDINNDGYPDLVLENDAVLFAVKKFSNEFINTSNMIILIENKLAGLNMTPKSSITIEEDEKSSYGNGSTELTEAGSYLLTSGIKLYLNTTNVKYEALFTLGAGQDYIELEVRNIEDN